MSGDMESQLSIIEEFYDNRSSKYDFEGGFHPRQAADYLVWADLKPGNHVLDLACGTGAIAIPAKAAVGESGLVFGIDISSKSLEIAMRKAKDRKLHVNFVRQDIRNLDGILGIEEGTFDIITCASALALLGDPTSAVRNWAKYLKPGGRIIFDVLTKESMRSGYILNIVAIELGVPLAYDRTKLDSWEKVCTLLSEVGLDPSETFYSRTYEEKILKVDDELAIFEDIIDGRQGLARFSVDFQEPGVRERAKESFCREFESLANEKGEVLQELKFCMAVGRKL